MHPNRCIICYSFRHFCVHTFPQAAFCEIEYQQPFSCRHTSTHWQEVFTNEVIEFVRGEALRLTLDKLIYGHVEVPSPSEAYRSFEIRRGDKTIGHITSFQPHDGKVYEKVHELTPRTYYTDGRVPLDVPHKKVLGPGIANLRAIEKLDLLNETPRYTPEEVTSLMKALGAEKVDDYWVLPPGVFHQGGISMSASGPEAKGTLMSGSERAAKSDLKAITEMISKHKAPAHVLDYGDADELEIDLMNEAYKPEPNVEVRRVRIVDTNFAAKKGKWPGQ